MKKIIAYIMTLIMVAAMVSALPFSVLADEDLSDGISASKALIAKLANIYKMEQLVPNGPENEGTPKSRTQFELDVAEEAADEYVESQYVEKVTRTPNSLVVRMCIGLTIVFPVSNVIDSWSNDYDIYTYQPWFEQNSHVTDDTIPLPEGITNEAEFPSAAAKAVADALPNCNYPVENFSKDEEIAFDDIKNIGPNQVVLFQGHGAWAGDEIHSVIWTKRDFDWDRFENDPVYRDDCENNRIVADLYNESISSKYIDKYCGDMTGSFIYLGQCESGHDSVLADSFLNKGASAVIANTEITQVRYGDIMQYTTVKQLAEINPDTGDYYTLGESLAKAKEMYGESDAWKYEFASGSIPTIFGDKNFRLATVKTEVPETTPSTDIPQAGDESSLLVWMVVLLSLLVLLAGCGVKKRKNR